MKRSTRNLLLMVGAAFIVAELLENTGTVARRKLSRGELVKLARDTGFPDADFAAGIAMRESGGDPMALDDTRGRTDLPRGTQPELSVGLWQINLLAHPQFTQEDMTDPKKNARAAFEISKHGTDWSAWSTAKQVSKTPPPHLDNTVPVEPEVTPGPPLDPGEPMPDGDDGGGTDF